MNTSAATFRLDPTPRRADGEYIAHVRIISVVGSGGERDIHLSGDLRGFDRRDDAIRFAADWGNAWIQTHCA